MSLPKKRKAYPSSAQKVRLTHLLKTDAELQNGKFTASFTKIIARERWQKIEKELNAIPGAKKNWEEWRKTWQDMKAKVKKKQAAYGRANQTGVESPPQELSVEEDTMSESAFEGHVDSQKIKVEFYEKEKAETPRKNQQQSLDNDTVIEKLLKEKNDIKKSFYENYINEMRLQTQALIKIANSLAQ